MQVTVADSCSVNKINKTKQCTCLVKRKGKKITIQPAKLKIKIKLALKADKKWFQIDFKRPLKALAAKFASAYSDEIGILLIWKAFKKTISSPGHLSWQAGAPVFTKELSRKCKHASLADILSIFNYKTRVWRCHAFLNWF